ncbi:MAG TPA: hypothetical protein VGJ32_15075 [Solirubrobacteraceae bacterium]|jgi:hypothetical protein
MSRERQLARRVVHRVKTRIRPPAPAPHRETPRDYFLAQSELLHRYAGRPVPPGIDLTPAELRVSSQNGEDGIIAEIMRRIGHSGPGYFVEFGVESGIEANCVFLADALGWSGLLIEADPEFYSRLERRYRANPRVRTLQSFVTPENIERLLDEAGAPDEPEVFSIDIDSDDYYVWEQLERRPKLLIIEYNGQLPVDAMLVQQRGETWRATDYYGASLGALEALGRQKGYRLVHTDLAGVNAFFVRDDLGEQWPEPPRRSTNFFLIGYEHPPDADGRQYIDVAAG